MGKILLANNVDSDQMPHNVASDLGLHCLSMNPLCVSGKNGLKENKSNNYSFPRHLSPSKAGSSLKGKNLQRQNFSIRIDTH